MASMVCFACVGHYLVLDLLLLGLYVEGKWKTMVGNVNILERCYYKLLLQ